MLAEHFLISTCREVGKRIPAIAEAAMEALESHEWPGNIRELANSIERAVIFADEGGPLEVEHLPPEIRRRERPAFLLGADVTDEREMILLALEHADGNKREAARLLGWYPQKLYSRLKKYGISTKTQVDTGG